MFFMKGAGYLCSPASGATQLSPSSSGEERNTGDDCAPTSLPRFRHTATFFHAHRLALYPPQAVPPAAQATRLRTSKPAAGWSSLTGRVGRHRPTPRHPCHHCKTRRALGPQPFSIFELFLVGGCLLFWVALYLEQYSTITQKNTVSQDSRKQIEQEA